MNYYATIKKESETQLLKLNANTESQAIAKAYHAIKHYKEYNEYSVIAVYTENEFSDIIWQKEDTEMSIILYDYIYMGGL